jgi:hypothetical protein
MYRVQSGKLPALSRRARVQQAHPAIWMARIGRDLDFGDKRSAGSRGHDVRTGKDTTVIAAIYIGD